MTVRFSLRRFRRIAWVAMFALMVNVLAPGISHALAAAGVMPADMVEICTPAGLARVSAADLGAGQDDGGALASSAVACAYCMVHAASFGLAPALAGQSSLRPRAGPPVFKSFILPPPARAWGVHSPRAPPPHA